MKSQFALATLLTAAGLASAQAASDDAWKEFAREVEEKCLAAAKGMIEAPKAVVDRFGSEKFGLALVTGKAKGAKVQISHICVMDKQTKAVELGSELGPDMMKVMLPK
jgi:hypothetical protein